MYAEVEFAEKVYIQGNLVLKVFSLKTFNPTNTYFFTNRAGPRGIEEAQILTWLKFFRQFAS